MSMISASKMIAIAAVSLALLAGCSYVPGDPVDVPPVHGNANDPPAPVQAPANVGASVSGSWTGYWTWDGTKWNWTWVWNASTGAYTPS